MKDRYKFPVMLILFVLMAYQIQKCGAQKYEIDSVELKNNFILKGVVDSFEISNNHCFAVIYLKNFESNFNYFNPKKNKKYFPYAVKGINAEVYVKVCSTFIDEGDSIIVDSNKRTVFFKTKSSGNHQSDLNFAQGDLGFIREKSTIFTENFLNK